MIPWWTIAFPVLGKYGDLLEELDLVTLSQPTPEIIARINPSKRELSLLRRKSFWPMREIVDQVLREEEGKMGRRPRPYLRDGMNIRTDRRDHESYRENAVASPTYTCPRCQTVMK